MGTTEIIGFLIFLISVYLFFYKLVRWIDDKYLFKVLHFIHVLLNYLFVGMIVTGFILFPALAHSLKAFSDPIQIYGVVLIIGGGVSLFVLYSYFIYRTSFFTGLLIAIIILPLSIAVSIKALITLLVYRRKDKKLKEETKQ